ncbi:MAG TPA: hypothetical protein VK056_02730 [Bacillota bacterium]|nr:hypothetical protein [Bacillota bacterium]
MKRLILIVSLLGLIFFSACGKSEDTEQEEPIDNNQTEEGLDEKDQEADDQTSSDSEQVEEEKKSTDDSSTKPSDESKDNDKSTEKNNEGKDPEAEIIKTGLFSGQADPHTIEVETDEGFVAYQLTMEARDLVADLEPGDKVTYTYYKDGEMLVIKHIEKVD